MKLEHPLIRFGGGAEAITPTLIYGPACGRACGPSSFLLFPSYFPVSFPHVVPRCCREVPALPFTFLFFAFSLLHEPMMSHINCLCLLYASC